MNSAEDVRRSIGTFLRQPPERLADDVELTRLVADSMILVNMVIELQEEFGVRLVQEDLAGVRTVGELLALFESKLQSPPSPACGRG